MAITLTKDLINGYLERVRALYLSDEIPWVVGYSGGKDSTATLQLVWQAIAELPVQQRHKPIHVISTDTLVEQPIVAAWVNQSLQKLQSAAEAAEMPIQAHRLTPEVKDTFWVSLIGRGYPTPRHTFRWCTDRLKIQPSNRFIMGMVARHGEAIVVLGTRKAESAHRAANMERYEKERVREFLSPNGSLPNSLVFSPIETWSSDEVWYFLMQYQNPWGVSNKDLLSMYRGASSDNECPLVVDSTTPSCGSSRFGCWVCTMVSSDKSMAAMIQNDDEKAWMTPLLAFRDELGRMSAQGYIDDYDRRDWRRMTGNVEYTKWGNLKRGPYTKHWREEWLRRLLTVERQVSAAAPREMGEFRLISDDEIREIRRIWVEDKHEFDDAVPRIWEAVKGHPYPWLDDLKRGVYSEEEWNLLKEACGDDETLFDVLAACLDVEQQFRTSRRRRGIHQELRRHLVKGQFLSQAEAQAYIDAERQENANNASQDENPDANALFAVD